MEIFNLVYTKGPMTPLLRASLMKIPEFQRFRNQVKRDKKTGIENLGHHTYFENLAISINQILDDYLRLTTNQQKNDEIEKTPFELLGIEKKSAKSINPEIPPEKYWIGTNPLFNAFTTKKNIDPSTLKIFVLLLDAKSLLPKKPQDLLIDDENTLEIEFHKLEGSAFVLFRTKEAIATAKVNMEYKDFTKGFKVTLWFPGKHTLEGKAFLKAFPSSQKKGNFELWFDVENAAMSISARLHLQDNMLDGNTLLNGVGDDNSRGISSTVLTYYQPHNHKELNFGKFEIEQPLYTINQKWVQRDRRNAAKRIPANGEMENVFRYLEVQPPQGVVSFYPNGFEAYQRFLDGNFPVGDFHYPAYGSNDLIPRLPTQRCEMIQNFFSETLYSLSRMTTEQGMITLCKWSFQFDEKSQNFHVVRENYHGNSLFEGYVYHAESHLIYIMMKDKRRQRLYTIDLSNENKEVPVKIFLTIGSSIHHNVPLAFRELLIRVKDEDYLNILNQFKADNLTYEQFLSLPDEQNSNGQNNYLLSNEHKMFLADRSMATLSFPRGDDLLNIHSRRMEATKWHGAYFIYAPYYYGQENNQANKHGILEMESLFRITLSINAVALCNMSVFYDKQSLNTTLLYEGFAQVINETLRLSLNTPNRQQMQVLLNVGVRKPDENTAIDGIMLDTDMNRSSAADLCYLVPQKVVLADKLSSIEPEKPQVIHKSDSKDGFDQNEYYRVESFLRGQFGYFTKFDEVYTQFKSIRQRPTPPEKEN